MVPLGVAGTAAAVGLLAGYDPVFALAAVFAIGFFLISFSALSLGVVLFTWVTFLELAPAIGGPALSFTKIAGLALALSWVAVIATDDRTDRLIFARHPALSTALALFVAWNAASLLWAENGEHVYEFVYRYALNLVLIPIVYTAINQTRHLTWLAIALAGGATAAALYGLAVDPNNAAAAASSTSAGQLDRVAGTVGDPNVLAATLVIGVVMAVTLALIEDLGPAGRLLAGVSAGICLLGILVTLSRGGLVALAAAGLAGIVFVGARYRAQFAVVAVSIAVVGVAWYSLFAPAGAVDRITKADGGTGRTDIWKVGWRMVESQPMHGVGAGNFQDASIHFLLVEPGALERDEFIVDEPAVAHNLYLQILAELGIVGLVLFLGVIGASLWASVKAAWSFSRTGAQSMELISRAVVISMVAVLAADFFLSNQFDKRLWLLVALGPALLHIARMREDAARRAESDSPAA